MMPISVLITVIAGLTIGMYFVLRPLKVMNTKDFIVSHGFVVVGLLLIIGWIGLNREKFLQATMLMGGIWTLFGGLCLVTVYVLRKKNE